MDNILYYGDNLDILREYIKDESIDLIYLDPPFNSKRNYNILFSEENGSKSPSQIRAFDDTWNWGEQTERTFLEIREQCSPKLVEMLRSFVDFIGRNDITAYLTMMAIRLVELHRVLKSSGGIYLHCDPTASHYLKILMDIIFEGNFQNEIVWCYEIGGRGKKRWARKHDTILFYSKSKDYKFDWRKVVVPRKSGTHMKIVKDENGREYQEKTDAKTGKIYRYYIDEGAIPPDWWIGIQQLNREAAERLGYPTQKPIALLERIIQASSDEKSVVLDPFCGCGTTIDAAEKLDRKWIGIDITHIAINLIKYRLRNRHHLEENIDYKIIGEPRDLSSAKALANQDRYQFEWWALGLIQAKPYQDKKKGADTGIDGISYFQDGKKVTDFKSIIVQVKSGNVSVKDIRELNTVVDNKKGAIGVLITLQPPTKPMITESASKGFYKYKLTNKNYSKIQILTIKELLDGKKIDCPPTIPFAKKAESIGDRHKQESLLR